MTGRPKGYRVEPRRQRSVTEKVGSAIVIVGIFTGEWMAHGWNPPVKPARSIPGVAVAAVGLLVWTVGTVRSRRVRSE
jgi:drug/metabolite transporter (DMT)-like permease